MPNFSPAQIEMAFADGTYLFRLPCTAVAEVQDACGTRVTFPDGATARRAKPLGAIWREHAGGLLKFNGQQIVDHAALNFNAADSREVVLKALTAGGKGVVNGSPVTLDRTGARILVEDYFDALPIAEQWKLATSILFACCEGFIAEEQPPGKQTAGTKETSSSTSPTQPGA